MSQVVIDAIDRKILKYLITNARMPFLEIARKCGISGAAIHQRIKKLDESGVILGSRLVVDPKMLELSVYDGIPHLLTPVVTDPKKAVMALKWAVREMEDRYRRMSKLGVRNVASYNERAREAQEKGEHFERTVQTGFDEQGRPVYESEKIRPEPMPYLVVVMDEMADLMMVAGKKVEQLIARLAQKARAAGMRSPSPSRQRPSWSCVSCNTTQLEPIPSCVAVRARRSP